MYTKDKTIINHSDIDNVFESLYSTIISHIQKSLGKSSGWIVDSVVNHTIKYKPLHSSSYIKLPKELVHTKEGLIIAQNVDDNEFFKWCLAR